MRVQERWHINKEAPVKAGGGLKLAMPALPPSHLRNLPASGEMGWGDEVWTE